MPVVLLVRHGQASFGAADYDELSDAGRTQAEAVGAELARRGLREPVAVHGTLRRQRDTARISLAAAGLVVEPRVDGRWDEYDHLGLLTRFMRAELPDGRPPSSSREMQRLLDAALLTWVGQGGPPDHSDGWPAFSGGATAALDDLLGGLDKGRDAVVFTSAGVIAAVCAALLGLPAEGFVALNRVAVNGAVTKLVAGSGGTSLLTFNEHGHLDAGAVTYR
jgi:broad specificity phosphatase PhoE